MSHPEMTVANEDWPGLLRVPTELRFEIYKYVLGLDVEDGLEKGVDNLPIMLSRQLFRYPLVRVCRRIRHEAIAWTHKFPLTIPVGGSRSRFDPSIVLNWLNDVDVYTIQCLEGLSIKQFGDRCCSCGIHNGDNITIDWSGGAARLEIFPVLGSCPVKLLHDKRRAYLARTFVKDTNAEGSITKLNVINLIRAMEDVGR